MQEDKKTLVIVAGAAGEIGKAYCRQISGLGIDVVGIIRNREVGSLVSDNFTQLQCYLDNPEDIEEKFEDVYIESYTRIIFLHSIGNDKFNPRNYPHISKLETIDPDVYDTNVNSFKYLFRYLVKRIADLNYVDKRIVFKTAIIAGVSDMYAPFVIEDFCEAKMIMRGYIRSCAERFPGWFSGLSINITSTVTQSAMLMRPHADTSDWLSPGAVVDNSVDKLLSHSLGYREIDVIKFSRNFVKGYYENDALLFKKWSKETGLVSA